MIKSRKEECDLDNQEPSFRDLKSTTRDHQQPKQTKRPTKSDDRQKRNHVSRNSTRNLIISSSLSLLLLVTHTSFDDPQTHHSPLILDFLPHWAALLGMLLGVVLVECCMVSYLGYKCTFVMCVCGFVVCLLFRFDPRLVPLTFAGLIEGDFFSFFLLLRHAKFFHLNIIPSRQNCRKSNVEEWFFLLYGTAY